MSEANLKWLIERQWIECELNEDFEVVGTLNFFLFPAINSCLTIWKNRGRLAALLCDSAAFPLSSRALKLLPPERCLTADLCGRGEMDLPAIERQLRWSAELLRLCADNQYITPETIIAQLKVAGYRGQEKDDYLSQVALTPVINGLIWPQSECD